MDDYLLDLYTCARTLEPNNFHRGVLEKLRSRIQFDSAIWTVMGSDNVLRGACFSGAHPGLAQGFLEIASGTDEQKSFFDAIVRESGKTVLGSDVIPTDDLVKTEYYREYALPFGIPVGIGYSDIYIEKYNARTSIHLNLENPLELFPVDVKTTADRVFPHLVSASLLNTSVFSSVGCSAVGDIGFAICQCDGLVLKSDIQFRRIFEMEWPKSRLAIPSFCFQEYADSSDKLLYHGHSSNFYITHSGPFFLCRSVLKAPFDRSLIESLTVRELEVAILFSDGKSYKEIAMDLAVSVKTIDNHASNIRRKLKIDSTRDLVMYL